jgi:hypothetical protein
MEVFAPMDVLCKAGCLQLWKFNQQTMLDQDFSKFPQTLDGLWQFLGQNGFHIKLTPKGQWQLNEMEAATVEPKRAEHRPVGFHANR